MTSRRSILTIPYAGLPEGSPSDSPYFSHPLHTHDRYSISFRFTPKRPISGNDLVFGNDFDHPIRDRLPPGFSMAFRIVKWMIDPGLEGDPYADEPWLYGPVLSSVNILRVGASKGEKVTKAQEEQDDEEESRSRRGSLRDRIRRSTSSSPSSSRSSSRASSAASDIEENVHVVKEGAVGSGKALRKEKSIPPQSAARMKHFLYQQYREQFTFEKDREYSCDFFNPYLDFNEFSLRLPGFTLPILKHWEGQEMRYIIPDSLVFTAGKCTDTIICRDHALRYVLKDRSTGELLFCVIFTMMPVEHAKDGHEGETTCDAPEVDGAGKTSASTDHENEKQPNANDDDVD
jgi:hypothetical protein